MKSSFARALIMSFAFAGMVSACSNGGGSSGSSSSTELQAGVTAVNAKLNEAASVIDSATPFMPASRPDGVHVLADVGLDTAWDTATQIRDMYDGTTQYALKDWFADQFNPNFVNDNGAKVTFVGRVSNTLNILCFMGAMGFPTDATNLPTVGTHTGTLTSAMATACGDASATGSGLVFTVTNTTDTTLYDRNISVDMGNACPFLIKARVSATAINVATGEDQTCDGRDQASGSVILYDKAADKIRFTYISKAFSGTSGFEFYRGYYDGSADVSYILGFNGSDDTTQAGEAGLDGYISYAVVGKPTAGGTVAVSALSKGNTLPDNTYNGCIDPGTLDDTSTGSTLACTITGVNVTTPHTDVTVATRTAKATLASIYGITETTSVGFTDNTDLFTTP